MAALVLLWAGITVTVLSCLGALRARRVYVRLHYLSPVTSIGAPLAGLALAVANGWGLTTAEDLFIVFVLAITGPALEAATGRVAAQREGLLEEDSPQ
ncbi:MAG TPA: monovalent cation/H(+) antiporter subunit G [Trebonia sp.]|nr:monovalent cation/H(+) antiporter subunit G [Trebonia sp.]